MPCLPEEKCLLCKSSKNGTSNCKNSNVGYSIKCNNCQGFDKPMSYKGETCRTGYIRGQEHLKQLESKSEKSVMWKHIVEEHKADQDKTEFSMKISGIFKDPMTRQLDEACRIQRKKKPNIY